MQPVLQSWSAACKRMRPFLSEVSRKPQFNHVTFAELDVGAEGTSVRPPISKITSVSRLHST
jgi:thiol-disulfide isomerase/thioredoxin